MNMIEEAIIYATIMHQGIQIYSKEYYSELPKNILLITQERNSA